MATLQNVKVGLGETWKLKLYCCDEDGAALDLTGGSAALRIGDAAGVTISQDTTSGAQIVGPATQGVVAFAVAPAAQSGVSAGLYTYEGRAILADGTVSTQALGSWYVAATLFPHP